MSKTIRISIPPPPDRNPLVMNGGKGTGAQVFKDKRNKRAKDAKRSWQRDYAENDG